MYVLFSNRHEKEKFAFHSPLNDILLVKNQQCHIIFMEFYQKSNVSQCHTTTYLWCSSHRTPCGFPSQLWAKKPYVSLNYFIIPYSIKMGIGFNRTWILDLEYVWRKIDSQQFICKSKINNLCTEGPRITLMMGPEKIVLGEITVCEDFGSTLCQNHVGVKFMFGETVLCEEPLYYWMMESLHPFQTVCMQILTFSSLI